MIDVFPIYERLWCRAQAEGVWVHYQGISFSGEAGYFHSRHADPNVRKPMMVVIRPYYVEPMETPSRDRSAGAPLPPPDLVEELVTLAHEYGHWRSFRGRTPRNEDGTLSALQPAGANYPRVFNGLHHLTGRAPQTRRRGSSARGRRRRPAYARRAMGRRDLSLAAQRFTVLTIKRGGRSALVGDRHVAATIGHANELDAIVANLRRAVTLMQKHLDVTRTQAIELLTPWACDDDGVSFEDRALLALLENDAWEPHRGRRLEVLERVTDKTPSTLDKALKRARRRRRERDK